MPVFQPNALSSCFVDCGKCGKPIPTGIVIGNDMDSVVMPYPFRSGSKRGLLTHIWTFCGNNWRSFFDFCSLYKLELERVKPYHFGLWLKRHPGSVATQRQHLAAVPLLFDHLLEKGIVKLNPAARAKPPRLEREPLTRRYLRKTRLRRS